MGGNIIDLDPPNVDNGLDFAELTPAPSYSGLDLHRVGFGFETVQDKPRQASSDPRNGFNQISSLVTQDSLTIALDVGSLMTACDLENKEWEGQSPMVACIDAILGLAKTKLNYFPEDEFSLLLYNTVSKGNIPL
ncbi:hypothetical protein DSO57_1032823 [Entomophthora muscae]|uniref:Uncharacterized protein n=1 Tax=Entomophthora muscae TaxID=34485 RepID=A0ACC2TBK3_9FUNG|nr:hypothetical protein DSO57_1032823 [Entomophthora muscae]